MEDEMREANTIEPAQIQALADASRVVGDALRVLGGSVARMAQLVVAAFGGLLPRIRDYPHSIECLVPYAVQRYLMARGDYRAERLHDLAVVLTKCGCVDVETK